MRRTTGFITAAVLLIMAVGAGPASARPAPSNLRWNSPAVIMDGVPVSVSSIKPCPTTRPDGSPIQGTLSVFVTLTFTGGGIGQGPIAVNPDGSWADTLTFNAAGTHDPRAKLSASCQDVTFTGTVVGSYKTQTVSLNP